MADRELLHQKELLSKVEELNKKIIELQNVSVNRNTGIARSRRISLDFTESDNIHEIEAGIRDTMDGIILSKAALCKALANIDKKRLYTQVRAGNFMEYLDMARIPINYKTAKEYAKIGDTMIRYDKELTSVDFSEEDGLKKLVYLDKALDQCPDDPEMVFQKVKESSLRDFQHWIQELKEEKQMQDETQVHEHHTVDQSGMPYAEFILEGNTIFIKTGPAGNAEVIITKPENIGIDPHNDRWKVFVIKLQELITEFYLKRDGDEGE